MYDSPTLPEIIGAAAAFLRQEVMPKLDGGLAFQLGVTANALDLVQRQLEAGALPEDEDCARMRTLLGVEAQPEALNTALCAAIDSGDLELADKALVVHLWATTLSKLAVDQPSYAAYRAALAERPNSGTS